MWQLKQYNLQDNTSTTIQGRQYKHDKTRYKLSTVKAYNNNMYKYTTTYNNI